MASKGLMIGSALGQGLQSGVEAFMKGRSLRNEEERQRKTDEMAQKGLLLKAKEAGYDIDPETGGLIETEEGKAKRQLDAALTRAKIEMLKNKGGGGFGKQLSQDTVLKVNEGKQMPGLLTGLEQKIKEKEKLMGPFENMGLGLGIKNPYNTDKRALESELGFAAQRIGKYLEGGVLRAEDVPKYKAMLPQLTDTPELAKEKLNAVRGLLRKKAMEDVGALKSSGYDTRGLDSFEDLPAEEFGPPTSLKTPTWNDGIWSVLQDEWNGRTQPGAEPINAVVPDYVPALYGGVSPGASFASKGAAIAERGARAGKAASLATKGVGKAIDATMIPKALRGLMGLIR